MIVFLLICILLCLLPAAAYRSLGVLVLAVGGFGTFIVAYVWIGAWAFWLPFSLYIGYCLWMEFSEPIRRRCRPAWRKFYDPFSTACAYLGVSMVAVIALGVVVRNVVGY